MEANQDILRGEFTGEEIKDVKLTFVQKHSYDAVNIFYETTYQETKMFCDQLFDIRLAGHMLGVDFSKWEINQHQALDIKVEASWEQEE